MPFSRGSSRPRDQTRVFCTADESLPSEPQRKPNKGFRVIQGKSLKRWLWPTLQAPVPSLSSLHLSLKSSPSSFHPILLPTTSLYRPSANSVHRTSRVLFHHLSSSLATGSCQCWHKKTSGFWCGWGPRGAVFQVVWLKHPRLKGLLPDKNKIHLALKIWSWLAWQRGKIFFFSREWKSTDKTSEANVSKHFQPTCSFRISADQQKAKVSTALDARLKKVLFCPTGQRSYECFEVRVITWSKCFRKIN